VSAISPAAHGLLLRSLGAEDRVLVTGAGGWFGTTLTAMLAGGVHPAMFVTQRPRQISFGTGSAEAVAWSRTAIDEFAPTIVIDCAFILRDHIDAMPLDAYVHANTVLTSRLLQLVASPSVHTVISVSSGAAVHPVDAIQVDVDANPYAYLKRQAELAVERAGETLGVRTLIARPWSVTGGLVTRPERYAFSNLIRQIRTGAVSIDARHEVIRRFVGVDDFFAVCVATAVRGGGVIDSGGERIELGALAHRMATVLGTTVDVRRAPLSDAPADDYCSTGESWLAACAALDFTPSTLDEQIVAVDTVI
jgi:nucleoside-diphosphate-sugar epimerase